jgi:phosphoenolpyruvate carboxykinase (ATP)
MNQVIEKILGKAGKVNNNLSPAELTEAALNRGEGVLADSGALASDTGEFTGRSPKDKFCVKDSKTENTVWWGDINQPFDSDNFDSLLNKVVDSWEGKEIFARDAYACADPNYRLTIKVFTESAYNNLFCHNLFLRPTKDELKNFDNEWVIINAPSFHANPEEDGTRQHNFSIINFTRKIILIGGSGYTGEMKKGIFTVLNYILPEEKNVLSMHCSANIGNENDDTAIFFGLSGTGKTTLSADPNRRLIGDDEHGWSGNTVFNFEGGCYAKCIDLTQEKEPQIFNAIKFGTLLENIRFEEGTRIPDYTNTTVTENTRAAYPIYSLDNTATPSVGTTPKNIFFLTADAFGVLPPISKLTPEQAMYHFISGYTAKVAGTEAGVTEPQATFSACFGKAFLPLHPGKYATMLGEKLKESGATVWLVNTGWSGGAYGTGSRMKLSHTRAMITAALEGKLDNVEYTTHNVFGLAMPNTCPDVPDEILHPRGTWADTNAYDKKANHLAELFINNFKEFEDGVTEDIKSAAPKAQATA